MPRPLAILYVTAGTAAALLATSTALPLQQSATTRPFTASTLRPALRTRAPSPTFSAATAASLEASAPPPQGAPVGETVIGMAKNIVGSGVLALAAGVAAFSGSKTALLPALALLLAVGAASAYSFSLIARVGDAVGGTNYRDTWAKVFGEKTAILPDVTCVFMTMVAGLCYSIILGDLFASIGALAGLPPLLHTSNAWIVLLSVFVLLPLSLLRDLSSLSIGSVIGNAGTLYTSVFMWVRLLDGSYKPGGKFYGAITEASRPKFVPASALNPVFNSKMFVLVSMLASAYLAHYNAPKFYDEMAAPENGKSKVPRFNMVCAIAFTIAAVVQGVIMAGGYLTFGAASNGLILNNYATKDSLAFVARIGIALSVLFSYPINFVGLREGVFAMFKIGDKASSNVWHTALTVGLLTFINGGALFIKDLGLVVGLGGAILGSALVYIFPAMMAIGEKQGAIPTKGEKAANYGLAALGVFFAGLGATMCLKGA